MIRLLSTCVRLDGEKGMRHLFIDAMNRPKDGFLSLGK